MNKVLLVDDDVEVFRLIKSFASDYELDYCETLTKAESYLKLHSPQLILLDMNLEDGNGLDFFIKNKDLLQKSGSSVIMLTNAKDVDHKVNSFDVGASDYIVKPFEPRELNARIKAHIKKPQNWNDFIVKHDLLIKPNVNRVYLNVGNKEEEIELSQTEFKLLFFLLSNEEQIFTRDDLIHKVWGSSISVSGRTVDQHISKLRKKVKSQFYAIRTVHNSGYTLNEIKR
jgi:DNA-binding response OmpR family regulator